MKNEKKEKSRTFYRIGFCFFMAVVFLAGPLHTAGQEKPLFTGNFRLSNHYEGYNGLFTQGYWSGAGNTNQAQSTQIKDKPRVSTGKFFTEIFLGAAANVACGFAGGLIGYQIDKGSGDDGWFDGLGGALLGISAGSTFGSALGVYLVGNSGNVEGSFGKALLGSVLGEGLAILLTTLTKNGVVAYVSFIALPPVCAALLYNSSLRYKLSTVSHALLNFNKGEFKMGVPYVHIQPLPGYAENVKSTVRFNINLVNIVF